MSDWYAPVMRSARNPDPSYFSFGDRACILWVLTNVSIFQEGHWPPDRWEDTSEPGKARHIKCNGNFCTSTEVLAEIHRRLDRCGYDGELVKQRYEHGVTEGQLAITAHRDTDWIEHRINRALNYISKADFRKRPLYKVWCGHGWQSSKTVVKY